MANLRPKMESNKKKTSLEKGEEIIKSFHV